MVEMNFQVLSYKKWTLNYFFFLQEINSLRTVVEMRSVENRDLRIHNNELITQVERLSYLESELRNAQHRLDEMTLGKVPVFLLFNEKKSNHKIFTKKIFFVIFNKSQCVLSKIGQNK